MHFAQWLYQQINRDDAIGHLAKIVEDTRPKNTNASNFEAQLRRFQNGWGIGNAQLSDLRQAYREYKVACQDASMMHEIVDIAGSTELELDALKARVAELEAWVAESERE